MTTSADAIGRRPWPALAGIGLAATLAVIALLPLPQGRTLESTLFAVFAAFAVVGSVVVAKRPRHPVGWLMTALGLVGLGASAAQNYAYSAFRAHGGQRPGAGAAAWAGEVPWGLMLALFVLLVIVFPTGRPPTRRWAPLAWAVTVLGLTNVGLAGAMYWPERHRIVAIDVYEEGVDGIYTAVPVGYMLIGICLLAAAASFVVRYRRSTGVERAQLKWFAFASVISPLFLLEPLLREVFGITSPVVAMLGHLGFLTIPLAAGLAVLRYRLYDIDRVVSRTVSYAVVTGILVAVYAGGIFVISPLVAGVGGGSELAVAAATLGWPRPSDRCAGASRTWWTGASTALATTPSARSRRSPPTCAARSTSTSCRRPSCTPSTSRWPHRARICGCGPCLEVDGHEVS
jgi:hypothetical protein